MKAPRASIVVLSWNGLEQHLDTCLSSACKQSFKDREIILVDNGSSDGTAEEVPKRFPDVRVTRLEHNRGVAGGVNHGIREAKGEFIALLNNDTEVDPEWLAESVRALTDYPEAGFTASRIRLFYERGRLDTAGDIYFRAGFPAKRGWLELDGPEYDRPVWVFGACAGAAVYRRAMVDDLGYFFDEDFGAVLEDLDLSFRGQLKGYGCRYVPGAIVYHKLGATLGVGLAKPDQQFRMHRNLWLVRIKNLPTALWLRYLPLMLAAEALLLMQGLRRGRLGVLLRARLAVIKALPKTLAKRRVIQGTRTVSAAELRRRMEPGWFRRRIEEKRREAAVRISGS